VWRYPHLTDVKRFDDEGRWIRQAIAYEDD